MSRVRPDIVTVEMVLELMEKSDSKKQHMDPSLFGSRGAVFQHEFAICSGHSSGVRPTHSASFNHDLSEGGRETGEQSAPINPLLSLSLSLSFLFWRMDIDQLPGVTGRGAPIPTSPGQPLAMYDAGRMTHSFQDPPTHSLL